MRSFRLILFSIASVLLCFCSKKEVPAPVPVISIDTIKPGSYFPVYPGSWWKYKVTDTISTQIQLYSTDSNYILSDYYLNYKQTKVYTPFFYNKYPQQYWWDKANALLQAGPIYGYFQLPKVSHSVYWEVNMKPIQFLSETPGACHIRPGFTHYDNRNGNNTSMEETYLYIEKKKVGEDSVLHVTGRYLNQGVIDVQYFNRDQITHTEYTKWKGLTLKWNYDTLMHDTLLKVQLLDYYINR